MNAINGEPSGDQAVADARLIKSIVALVPAADNEANPFLLVLDAKHDVMQSELKMA